MRERELFEALQAEARLRWGQATAFRIGLIAGERGETISNPYVGNAATRFAKGLAMSHLNPLG